MIYDVYKTVLTIANKENYGEITPERFGYLAFNAQNKLFSDILSEYRRSKGKEYNSLRLKLLRSVLDLFYVTDAIRKSGSNTYYNLDELSSDIEGYAFVDSIWYRESIPVHIADKGLSGLIKRSKYLKATKEFPYAEIQSNKLSIFPIEIGQKVGTIYPNDISVSYYRYPSRPIMGVENNVPADNAEQTVDFELPNSFFNKLAVSILEQIGVTLREAEVEAYANKESQTTTQTDNL